MQSTDRDALDVKAPNSVLGRALGLLAAFRPGDDELSLAELHRRTGVAKPTAHRLLAELCAWGVVERTPSGIRLGMRLFELGQLVPRQRGLREAATPFLTDLFEATHETVHLAVRGRGHLRPEARRPPGAADRVAGRGPDAGLLHRRRQSAARVRPT